ncbi:MAG: flagellar hook assembly protein FlgD [Gammaproteobacteria bacterium]|nr:flagellar hook assembly protein FlgD [Gammaproteobacteria bacterium]MBU2058357.1 flagellar hook assembly protein FlgD [Gammaproteobacteria bacterium]MBU2176590.1 flagellar hook assembly protein FlgD [Gammaproteobacteria bacterium]MBU2248468.1 flagellar hook assembly protein FlgD [Gammaproteobacteria bacterium]MBU2345669.1 flagellar hook assembly protein FlgD [Gammaproteobacteria bacterium]
MSNVTNDKSALDGMYWGEKPTTPESEGNGALTQSDFFALLTQQLAYQDPTKPVENDQMIAQMTNFTMADGISQMNTNFKDFATSMNSSQALQASSLVGQYVLVKSDKIEFDGENTMVASANFPENATNVKVRIKNADGVVVRSVSIPDSDSVAGRLQLPWNGATDTQALNEDGTPKVNDKGEPVMELAPKGVYSIEVEGSIAGKNEAIVTSVYAPVTSITLGNGTTQGLLLNVLGQGQKKLSDIEEIAT